MTTEAIVEHAIERHEKWRSQVSTFIYGVWHVQTVEYGDYAITNAHRREHAWKLEYQVTGTGARDAITETIVMIDKLETALQEDA